MSRHIESLIRFCGGPITLAEYMEEVLTNPTAGYYMHRDVFGTDGDFVTSPDISQMFGEGTAQFQPFAASLSVHLVECSPALRQLQWKAMRCSANSLTSDGSTSGSTDTSQESSTVQRDPVPVQQAGISAISQVPVSWHLQLEDIPRGDPAIVIAHEFFDALPVHQFQMTDRGWCEKLVDVAQQPRDQEFRCVLSPHPTPAVSLYLKRRLMLMSPEERRHHKQMEVCPAGMKLAVDLAKRVGEDGGAALIIDYGEDHAMADTLQAIRKHEFVDVLETPGLADLSAYVDFEALRQAVKSSGGK
ncbi:hypothetical protein CBR_g40650 [Chara braunii]|uniref:Protein arginine methyltransferase NDUFAF7 n=1 Tax=Chara braunii TaxID=69332 RepID=A0A388LU48_CHABU|nr:hypothetical protein CBR_g40650 [Chara braunii]|eukprot:GBG85840.1 hypothetical protein CBR_g40650 [Chara braunii]